MRETLDGLVQVHMSHVKLRDYVGLLRLTMLTCNYFVIRKLKNVVFMVRSLRH